MKSKTKPFKPKNVRGAWHVTQGITLIALIITVIVMLILAGVAISAINNVGLFDRITKATELYNNSVNTEENTINSALGWLDNTGGQNNDGSAAIVTVPTPAPAGIADGTWDDTAKVNTPKLATGMIAVYWAKDSSGDLDTTQSKNTYQITQDNPNFKWANWYNYGAKRWANAVTINSSGNITGYWTWIPRYAYQITSQYNTAGTGGGNINIKFLKGTTNTAGDGKTTWDNVSGLNKWNIHPAFQNGSPTGKNNKYANGEWDAEIPGIWVAKFPAGFAGGNNNVPVVSTGVNYQSSSLGGGSTKNFYGQTGVASSTFISGQMNYPVFLPKTYPYNQISIGDSFVLSQNLGKSGNIYGIDSSANSHLMKNSEWGAVAYLTQSNEYGANANIYINNIGFNGVGDIPSQPENGVYTITGYAGTGPDAGVNKVIIEDLNNGTATDAYAWNTANGQKGSSTGNTTGIYDLSTTGFLTQMIAGLIIPTNMNNYHIDMFGVGFATTSETVSASNKYKTIYTWSGTTGTNEINNNFQLTSAKYGDATYETSGWYDDMMMFPFATMIFIVRGGYYENAGIYTLVADSGGLASEARTFRTVLIP